MLDALATTTGEALTLILVFGFLCFAFGFGLRVAGWLVTLPGNRRLRPLPPPRPAQPEPEPPTPPAKSQAIRLLPGERCKTDPDVQALMGMVRYKMIVGGRSDRRAR